MFSFSFLFFFRFIKLQNFTCVLVSGCFQRTSLLVLLLVVGDTLFSDGVFSDCVCFALSKRKALIVSFFCNVIMGLVEL